MHALPRSLTVLAALCVLALPPGQAEAAEAFDNCTNYIDVLPAVLTSPGYYCLRADLATASSTGVAVAINADNVTVDCNDFKIGGLGAGSATQAYGFTAGFTVKNPAIRRCNVRGFFTGIYLYSANALVEDNLLDGNKVIGIGTQGKRARIRRNQVLNTGNSPEHAGDNTAAIFVGSESEVSDNVIVGVSTTGSGEPFAIRAWDSYEPNGVLGSISGNHISGLHRGNGARFYAIHLYFGRAVVSGNELVTDATGTNAGAFYCEAESSNSIVRNNTIAGFVAPIIGGCVDGGGNVSN